MKKLFLAFTIVITTVVACTENKKTPVSLAQDQETLRYLKEVEWPTAYREQDTILLDRILSENFQLIDQSGGRFSKSDELSWIKEHAMEHDSFFYEIKRLEIFPNGTAVVAGTGHIYNDSSYSTYESSNVLIKRDNAWKAVLSHVSGVKNLE